MFAMEMVSTALLIVVGFPFPLASITSLFASCLGSGSVVDRSDVAWSAIPLVWNCQGSLIMADSCIILLT